jgi:hypothetical protein
MVTALKSTVIMPHIPPKTGHTGTELKRKNEREDTRQGLPVESSISDKTYALTIRVSPECLTKLTAVSPATGKCSANDLSWTRWRLISEIQKRALMILRAR